jgi:hypothetical protein
MAESQSDFAKLTPEQRQALAKKYAQRLINASYGSPTALDNFGKAGTYRTDEAEFEAVGKALLNIKDSAFTKLVDDELRQMSDPDGRYESKGLRDLITSEFSLGEEDKILNLFGLPTDSLLGESLQAQSVEDPSIPDYDKFGSGGFIPSPEYSPEEAITSEGEGTGSIEDRYQVDVLNKTPEEVRKEAAAKAGAKAGEAAQPKQQPPAAQPAQNVFNMDDPQAAAINQQLAAAKSNPFLAGTDAERAQIANLLDIGNGKVAMPNRSDRRSMAKFNDSVKSKEFVLNAAKRKARDLQSLEESRRAMIEGSEDTMAKWIEANPSHAMSKKGLDNWTDKDKVNFYRNYKLGNLSLDKPLPPQDPFVTETVKKSAMYRSPVEAGPFTLYDGTKDPINSGVELTRTGPDVSDTIATAEYPSKPGIDGPALLDQGQRSAVVSPMDLNDGGAELTRVPTLENPTTYTESVGYNPDPSVYQSANDAAVRAKAAQDGMAVRRGLYEAGINKENFESPNRANYPKENYDFDAMVDNPLPKVEKTFNERPIVNQQVAMQAKQSAFDAARDIREKAEYTDKMNQRALARGQQGTPGVKLYQDKSGQNYNIGEDDFFDKVPIYGKNGLQGYATKGIMRQQMGGKTINTNPSGLRAESRRRDAANLDAIRKEGYPFYNQSDYAKDLEKQGRSYYTGIFS